MSDQTTSPLSKPKIHRLPHKEKAQSLGYGVRIALMVGAALAIIALIPTVITMKKDDVKVIASTTQTGENDPQPPSGMTVYGSGGEVVGHISALPTDDEQLTEIKTVKKIDSSTGKELLAIIGKDLMFKTIPFLLFCCVPFALQAAQLDLMTGPKTGTYYTIGKDIAAVAKQEGFSVDVFSSEGSIDNIKRMNQASTPALAIVQSDVLGFLNRSNNPALPRMLARLRVISPFYMEEVHVLARMEIHEFKQLQNMKIAVGEESSGHMLTAVNLLAIAEITPTEIRKITPEEGVVEVLRGNLDAVIVVGGKPLRLFKNMESLSSPEHQKYRLLMDQVHFIPMNDAKFYEEYEPTEISIGDYDFVKETVPTISVQSMLVSLDSATASGGVERCEALKKLVSLLRDNTDYLKRNGHPKWHEINLDKEVVGWKKDSCFE